MTTKSKVERRREALAEFDNEARLLWGKKEAAIDAVVQEYLRQGDESWARCRANLAAIDAEEEK